MYNIVILLCQATVGQTHTHVCDHFNIQFLCLPLLGSGLWGSPRRSLWFWKSAFLVPFLMPSHWRKTTKCESLNVKLWYCCRVVTVYSFSCNLNVLYSSSRINFSDENFDVVDSIKGPWSNFILTVPAQRDGFSCKFTHSLPGNVDLIVTGTVWPLYLCSVQIKLTMFMPTWLLLSWQSCSVSRLDSDVVKNVVTLPPGGCKVLPSAYLYMSVSLLTDLNKKLIRRRDSKCELFYDNIFNHF